MPSDPDIKNIHFYAYTKAPGLQNKTALKQFLSDLFKKEKKALEALNYIFCSNSYLLKMNRKYLGHDYHTDILTFSLSPTKAPIIGEIYISIDQIRRNADRFNVSIKEELHRVIFHGALHLCGYDDKTSRQFEQMKKLEDKCLSLYFSTYVPRGKKR